MWLFKYAERGKYVKRIENQSLNNRITELENQILEQVNLEELKAIVGELKTLINE